MINENMSFYRFMHKQILVVLALFLGTGPGYLLIGWIRGDMIVESLWYGTVVVVSFCGLYQYKRFSSDMTIEQKDSWLNRVRFFMFVYFSLWSVIFIYYILKEDTTLHYIGIATQLGSAVVASTILASQKKLVIYTVVTLMLPITIYLIMVGEIYSYLIAFFTIVLSGVLLYAAKNTHDYLLKSRYQAYHDHLTGLGNRRYLLELLESSVKQNEKKFSYLLLIDLDYFKTINDTLGHDIGDALLKEVSRRMKVLCKEYGNEVARLGGDEFCIISKKFEDRETCLEISEEFCHKMLRSVKDNYIIEENHLYISASIGVSIINKQDLQANEFLKEADMAMYEAKHNGRDGVILFNEEMCQIVERKLEIERMLHFAIAKNEIYLKYQPQVDAKRQIVGCEVLARWNNEKFGEISPEVFIPMAESTGYIVEVGAHIMEEAFKTIQEWASQGIVLRQISINISIRQLLNQEFINIIDRLYRKYDMLNCCTMIMFEITETSTADDLKKLVEIIHILKRYKIFFSMDDFGTGYSSLSYLREIPLDELKIDKSFVAELSDIQQASLVKTIIDIAKNLNLTIVAEGVEEEYQRQFLEELDCDLYQGYLFSRPIQKEEFEEYFCAKIAS